MLVNPLLEFARRRHRLVREQLHDPRLRHRYDQRVVEQQGVVFNNLSEQQRLPIAVIEEQDIVVGDRDWSDRELGQRQLPRRRFHQPHRQQTKAKTGRAKNSRGHGR